MQGDSPTESPDNLELAILGLANYIENFNFNMSDLNIDTNEPESEDVTKKVTTTIIASKLTAVSSQAGKVV